MIKNKVCFGTVIYKQARAFYDDLLASIDAQTDKSFDLLLVNDNYEKEELASLKQVSLPVLEGQVSFVDLQPKHCTIAQTRIEMIRAAKDMGYELLIVSDADDTFVSTRVASYKEAHEEAHKLDKSYAFYYNELVTDDGAEVLLDLPKEVTDVRVISQSNFIGMGTTAINLDAISYDFLDTLAEGDCPVFDWYFFTRILMDVGSGALVKDAATIYRIHDNNQVGVTHDINQEYQVKLTHYANLAKRYPYFGHLYEDLRTLDINKLEANNGHKGYWWSTIVMEDSYEI